VEGAVGGVVPILYLDQNKWVELAKAVKCPDANEDAYRVLEFLVEEVSADRLTVPLSSTNIYETQKINVPEQRHDIAHVQATLSCGNIFRGRHARLERETVSFLESALGRIPRAVSSTWFLSKVCFEAFADHQDSRLGVALSERVLQELERRPQHYLYEWLMGIADTERRLSIQQFSAGCEDLRQRIEDRRSQHQAFDIPTRRRIYSALLLIEELDQILNYARALDEEWNGALDIGEELMRQLVPNIPTLHIELELCLKLEAENRPIEENDMRDMQAFCSAIPYAGIIVAENHFVSLATQAGLGRKYDTRLETKLSRLLP
jgi:hypothetical protein